MAKIWKQSFLSCCFNLCIRLFSLFASLDSFAVVNNGDLLEIIWQSQMKLNCCQNLPRTTIPTHFPENKYIPNNTNINLAFNCPVINEYNSYIVKNITDTFISIYCTCASPKAAFMRHVVLRDHQRSAGHASVGKRSVVIDLNPAAMWFSQ